MARERAAMAAAAADCAAEECSWASVDVAGAVEATSAAPTAPPAAEEEVAVRDNGHAFAAGAAAPADDTLPTLSAPASPTLPWD
jgi:hypothetical protein